ncbi:amidohydrolase family protein [Leucobacter soli]|uniref:amidohydrolase family protein n=1 Tax=Leucobacter soli TaxID=2812850 RepID=UPI00361EF37F
MRPGDGSAHHPAHREGARRLAVPDRIGPAQRGHRLVRQRLAGHHQGLAPRDGYGGDPAQPPRADCGGLAAGGADHPGAALAAYTTGTSRQALAPERGTLEIGMVADAAWLSADPLTVDPNAIPEVAVRGTWLAGERIH